MPKSHAPTLRYMTSNKKIATVSKSGKIKAKTKGTCYIYAYAHNGVSKRIKITVK
ncbi:MAG: Ig-like domain-containing protein [Firmicutes bacterium]|nr:Ig-like domain-containing protein [Bacillota bacterium]